MGVNKNNIDLKNGYIDIPVDPNIDLVEEICLLYTSRCV